MRTRFFGALAAAAAVGFVLTAVHVTAQAAAGQGAAAQGGGGRGGGAARPAEPVRACPTVRDFAAFHQCALEKMKTFKPKLTADGKPDMNGIWSPTRSAQDIEEIKQGQYGDFPPSKSLIVDPPNGRIPYNAWAMKERINNEKVYLSPTAVCLPVAQPRWSYSPVSVTGHRIIQQPNLILLSMERLHTFRMIRMDSGAPALPKGIHLWEGDSRGRWEGNTLVIKTTNLNDLMWMDHIGTFNSPDIMTEERFTFVDADTIHYEETITDPNVFTQPWKIAIAFLRQRPEDIKDTMDLEDTTVENCVEELRHMMNMGQTPFPGYKALAPK